MQIRKKSSILQGVSMNAFDGLDPLLRAELEADTEKIWKDFQAMEESHLYEIVKRTIGKEPDRSKIQKVFEETHYEMEYHLMYEDYVLGKVYRSIYDNVINYVPNVKKSTSI